MTDRDSVFALRQALYSNGYQPVEVKTGEKVPARAGWPFKKGAPQTRDDALNTGLLCDHFCPLDFDVDDATAMETIARTVEAVAGHTPLIRSRPDSPRKLLLYRAPDGSRPKKRVIKLGDLGKIEILGNGQQFVAYGMHPGGAEFEWLESGPDVVKRDDVPILTPEHEMEIRRRLGEELGIELDPSPQSVAAPPQDAPKLSSPAPDNAGGSDFFVRIKDEALRRLGEWVPIAFPKAKFQPGTGAWSISSRDLGRSLEERLSFHPDGVQDFGTEQASSPISALIDHGIAEDATAAAHWFCDRLAIDYDALWAEAHPEPDIDLSRLRPRLATIDGEHVGEGIAQSPAPLLAMPASELDGAEPPPREWHVPDLIPARTVTILTGDGATGKSLLALQLAVATAINARWIGNEVKFGRCLFLTAEDEVDELHRRLFAIGKAEGFELSVLENLHVASLAGQDAVMAAPDRKTSLLKPTPLFERLRATVDAIRPALIVLDTLADLFGGNEVDRAQARQFVGMLRGLGMQFDCTVLLLAHPSLSGMSSGSGNSGSTAWNNSVRSRLYLRRIIREEGGGRIVEDDPDLRELTTMKANYGRSGDRTEMRWVEGRFVPTTDPIAANISLDGLGAGKAEAVFLKLLSIYLSEGRNVSCNPSSTYAPRVFAADDRCERVTAKAFQKAMNALLERREIENVIFGPPSKARFRLDFAFEKHGDGELPTPFQPVSD